VVLHRLAQRGEQLGPAQAGDLRQQAFRYAEPGDRRDAQQPLGGAAERVHPGEQHVLKRRRHAGRVAVCPYDIREFLDEVRVAARLAEDHVDGVGRGNLAEQGRQLLADLVAVEPPQVQAGQRPVPLPAGDKRAQRVPPVKLVGAVGDHKDDGRRAQQPHQERGQVKGGLVRPVHVLDHEEERLDSAQPGQRAEHELKQLRLLQARHRRGRVRRELGQQPGEAAQRRGAEHRVQLFPGHRPRQRPQRVHQRRQRKALCPQFHALAGEDPETRFPGLPGQFGGQPGLSDPGLAADERERRLTAKGLLQQGGQRGHFLAPPDKHWAGDAPGHGHKMPYIGHLLHSNRRG